MIKKRQEEWKHAKDIRLIYERKLQRTNDLYNELSVCFAQLEEREREIAEREKQIGTSKPYRKAISQLRKQHFDKINRRRLHIAAQFTQASVVPSPPGSPMKTSMYVQLDGNQTKSVIPTPIGFGAKYNSKKSRHRRVGSGGSMKTTMNRDRRQYESDNRVTGVVNIQTQTDVKDLPSTDEIDASTASSSVETVVKNPVVEKEESSSSESDIDDNVPQEDTTCSSQTNNNPTMESSMGTSVMTGSNLSYDTEEACENHRVTSDDDNLESLRRKVSELISETASNIESYCTISSTSTVINRTSRNGSKRHSRNCEKSDEFSCTDLPDENGFVDNNKNINVRCSCIDDDDDDANSCSEDEFDGAKRFNYSLRMKR